MRPWQLIALIFILGLLAVFNGWKPFWVLFYALLVAFALSLVWLALSVRGLRFTRSSVGARAEVGERIEERLALENHSWIPKLWVQVSDASTLPGHHAGYVSSVGPRQRIAWRARTLCRKRGRYTLGPVHATTGDPLGLFRRELTLAPATQLLVLPNVFDLRAFPLFPGVMPGRGRGAQRSLQTTTNVVTVRNYRAGDALTRIHWLSTARHGELMVKEFDLDPTIDVLVLLDLDKGAQAGVDESSTEEYGVTIAASLAAHLLRRRDLALALETPGPSGVSLPIDRGERQLDRVLEALAIVRADRHIALSTALAEMELRIGRNTALIVITPSTDLDWEQQLGRLKRRGVRPVVVLLDPSSFEENQGGMSRVEDALDNAGVPSLVVRRGDALARVLESSATREVGRAIQ
ncbi:MAG: DUF58 domain-containing protein [Chloroflexota bacterium]|nr:DUF58 domain-containing protein [Chloroflexota bacterium]